MEQNRAPIKQRGLGLAAISYDSVSILKAFADREHIGFPLLADPESKVIRSYGILNETVAKESPTFGIPYPGTYVLNDRGVVIAKYFEDDYRVRDTAESILLRQFGITPAPHESLQTKHLQLSLSGAETAVRPGQRISLAVQIELPRRMHVYAPGVTGYLPVSLTFKPSTAFRAEAVSYPPAKSLKLEAIHETALVYDRKFSLVDTITLANTPEIDSQLDNDRNLTIQAELRYQACDDRECFLPQTVPLQWRIHVLPFDRTRAPESLRRRP